MRSRSPRSNSNGGGPLEKFRKQSSGETGNAEEMRKTDNYENYLPRGNSKRIQEEKQEEEISEKLRMIIKENERLVDEKEEIEQKFNNLNDEHEKMCVANEQLLNANKKLNDSNEMLAEDLRRLLQEREELKMTKNSNESILKEERQRLLEDVERLRNELRESEGRRMDEERKREELDRRRLSDIYNRAENESKIRELEVLRQELNSVVLEKSRLEQDSIELLNRNSHLVIENSKLNEEIDRLRSSQQRIELEKARWTLQETQSRETGQKISILIQDNANLIKLCEDLGNEVNFWREKYMSYDKVRNFDFSNSEINRQKATIDQLQSELKTLQIEKEKSSIDRSIFESLKQENNNLKQIINGS